MQQNEFSKAEPYIKYAENTCIIQKSYTCNRIDGIRYTLLGEEPQRNYKGVQGAWNAAFLFTSVSTCFGTNEKSHCCAISCMCWQWSLPYLHTQVYGQDSFVVARSNRVLGTIYLGLRQYHEAVETLEDVLQKCILLIMVVTFVFDL